MVAAAAIGSESLASAAKIREATGRISTRRKWNLVDMIVVVSFGSFHLAVCDNYCSLASTAKQEKEK